MVHHGSSPLVVAHVPGLAKARRTLEEHTLATLRVLRRCCHARCDWFARLTWHIGLWLVMFGSHNLLKIFHHVLSHTLLAVFSCCLKTLRGITVQWPKEPGNGAGTCQNLSANSNIFIHLPGWDSHSFTGFPHSFTHIGREWFLQWIVGWSQRIRTQHDTNGWWLDHVGSSSP